VRYGRMSTRVRRREASCLDSDSRPTFERSPSVTARGASAAWQT
jgi:hypothetical protein